MTQATATPPDATRIYEWCDQDGQPVRRFDGPSWSLDGGEIVASVEGQQTPEGITRALVLTGLDGEILLTADQVLQLGEILQRSHTALTCGRRLTAVGAITPWAAYADRATR
jgi:hypothetical protein